MTTLQARTSDPAQMLQTLIVDDEAAIRGPVGLCLETLGYSVREAASAEEAIAIAGKHPLDVALVDLRLGTGSGLDLTARLLALQPRLRIIIITAYGSVDVAVRAMARGATDFLCKPFTPDQVAAAVARAASLRELEEEVGTLPDRWGTGGPEADFATTNAALQEAITTVRRAAPTLTPILIAGENGTGRSVLARAIHGWGQQPEGPFISIDCAARSPAYVDLILFGDAMAGDQLVAVPQPSSIAKAAGGTLLVKSVESLSATSQRRLAHLMEPTAQPPTGEKNASLAGVRLIATSREDARLEEPLRSALDRIHVVLPPLRKRAEDIPTVAQRYLAVARQESQRQVLGFSPDAIDHMMAYSWPGNLTELRDAVDEAFAAAASTYIQVSDLRPELRHQPVNRRPRAGDRVSLRDLEAAHIRELLATGISLPEAATILDLDAQALYRRRKQYGIE